MQQVSQIVYGCDFVAHKRVLRIIELFHLRLHDWLTPVRLHHVLDLQNRI